MEPDHSLQKCHCQIEIVINIFVESMHQPRPHHITLGLQPLLLQEKVENTVAIQFWITSNIWYFVTAHNHAGKWSDSRLSSYLVGHGEFEEVESVGVPRDEHVAEVLQVLVVLPHLGGLGVGHVVPGAGAELPHVGRHAARVRHHDRRHPATLTLLAWNEKYFNTTEKYLIKFERTMVNWRLRTEHGLINLIWSDRARPDWVPNI